MSASEAKADMRWSSRNFAFCAMVESRCGAVALGRTYPLPPLSSGGALVVPPSLRFHIPLIEPDRRISPDRPGTDAATVRRDRALGGGWKGIFRTSDNKGSTLAAAS